MYGIGNRLLLDLRQVAQLLQLNAWRRVIDLAPASLTILRRLQCALLQRRFAGVRPVTKEGFSGCHSLPNFEGNSVTLLGLGKIAVVL
jgi:hypothetical protein